MPILSCCTCTSGYEQLGATAAAAAAAAACIHVVWMRIRIRAITTIVFRLPSEPAATNAAATAAASERESIAC
jgi:hypothetical protein